MRNKSLLISTALALVLGSAAHAGTIDFMTTGAIVDYTVPQTAEYDIVAFGAQGGAGANGVGGLGAEIGGEFLLSAGNVLEIAVGGTGVSSSGGGGGGGGSFVYDATTGALLIAAGAGGGGGASVPSVGPGGFPGQTTTSGGDGGGGLGAIAMAGVNGQGGGIPPAFAPGGGAAAVTWAPPMAAA